MVLVVRVTEYMQYSIAGRWTTRIRPRPQPDPRRPTARTRSTTPTDRVSNFDWIVVSREVR